VQGRTRQTTRSCSRHLYSPPRWLPGVVCCLALLLLGLPAIGAEPAEADANRKASSADFDRLARLARQLAAEDSDIKQPKAPPAPDAPDQPVTDIAAPSAPLPPSVETPQSGKPLAAASQRRADPGSRPLGSPKEALPLGRNHDDGTSDDASPAIGSGWVLNTFTALAIVIGLIFVARAGYMKLSGQPMAASGNNSPVRVLSRTSIAPKSQVLLVSVGDRVLVVGDSAAGLRTLDVVDDAEETANLLAAVEAARPQSISRGFGDLLSRVNGDYDKQMSQFEGQDESEHRVDRARDSMSSLLSRVRSYTRPTGEQPMADGDRVELSLGQEGRVG